MNRRKLLQLGTAAASAFGFSKSAFAQAQNTPTPQAGGPKLVLDACSRSLQWLRTPDALAKGVIDLGLQNVDLTVTSYPGHVDPAKVKTDLPAFVNGLKQQGIAVRTVTTAVSDADSPNLEAILDAASGLGVRYYIWGGLKYDESQPYQPQLDALKPRVQKLAKLNEKYKVTGLYHPVAGAGNIGSSFFDILDVLRNFDPRFVGLQYDTGSLLQPVRDVFVSHMRLGGAYIGGMALNDATVTLDIPIYEFGPFDQTSQADANAGPAGDNTGNANGNPLAFGGGGRPLPYHVHPMRVGTGMIDLILIARTLKAMNFNGPMETQVSSPLGGVENGADKITLPRQSVLGQLKRDRLTVEHGFFAGGWNVDIVRPAFQVAGGAAGGRGGAGGAAGGAGGRGGAGPAPQ